MTSNNRRKSKRVKSKDESKEWIRPEVTDLGDVIDLVKGIGGGGGKEPGGNDNSFAPLEIS